MSIGNLIAGALAMYIYLRAKGVEPPPKLAEWELKVRSLLQTIREERQRPAEELLPAPAAQELEPGELPKETP